jgi:hypothetical protein
MYKIKAWSVLEAILSSESSVRIRTTRRYVPEDNIRNYYSENVKLCIYIYIYTSLLGIKKCFWGERG